VAKTLVPYPDRELLKRGPQPTYRGRNLEQIAFPLGGIGTGMVSLGGWGQLRDWEIRNRPAKRSVVPDAFFTLKVRQEGKEPITKVVQGPAAGDHIGGGNSMPRQSGEGLPHFRQATFKGAYPIATVQLRDPDVPVRVTLEAFNPFIPLNDKDSGIPVAIFAYRLKSTSRRHIDATLFGNLTNIVGHPDPEGRVNEPREAPGMTGLHLTTSKHPPTSPRFGSMALVTTWEEAAVWPRWKNGHGPLAKFWEAIAWSDEFPPEPGDSATGTVAAHVALEPGAEVTVPFLITWHFPVFEHWQRRKCDDGCECAATWRNYYASQWADAWDVAEYVVSNYDRLREETHRFHDTLFASTLPTHVLDAVSSQISILKTTTCLRLEDGTFYGFEGCGDSSGCCEGSCTHVWNYAQALPYLFPPLQRSMMEAHFANSMSDDGFIQFRMPLPLGTKAKAGFLPAADGQMGLVMQVYREWLIANDEAWLRRVWPQAKRALEFAWKHWDPNRDGAMEGVQHNTYDQEWWGPNTMTGSLYLGALRAGEELARAVGDTEAATAYRKVFEKGSAWTDKHLFNGQYYEQQVNPKANDLWPEPYHSTAERGKDDKFPAWPRWQFGKGCLSDQLIGEWYAAMLGLGHLYDHRNVRKALKAIFKHNWRPNLSDHPCLLRIYAVNDEAGLIIGTWPLGERPGYAFWFADEVWCGIEYQVASHLIYEGLLEEGLAIVKGVRDRHRGDRRNPWNEFECGHHYARSMASYALLPALSGFRYSAADQAIGFAPKLFESDFRAFFCVADAWGLYAQKVTESRADLSLRVDYGSLPLHRVVTPLIKRRATGVLATLGGQDRQVTLERAPDGYAVVFERPLVIARGQTLKIAIG
jgi:non-lysosomal glucosylceramidase